ncbi:MAG: hypothetical protein H6502_01575 [Candidatus Woesearchaeota archaeon]|nr:MAG: hypothetical protein H6502_01575 [Candidatus Woesearchaeota archaeon]
MSGQSSNKQGLITIGLIILLFAAGCTLSPQTDIDKEIVRDTIYPDSLYGPQEQQPGSPSDQSNVAGRATGSVGGNTGCLSYDSLFKGSTVASLTTDLAKYEQICDNDKSLFEEEKQNILSLRKEKLVALIKENPSAAVASATLDDGFLATLSPEEKENFVEFRGTKEGTMVLSYADYYDEETEEFVDATLEFGIVDDEGYVELIGAEFEDLELVTGQPVEADGVAIGGYMALDGEDDESFTILNQDIASLPLSDGFGEQRVLVLITYYEGYPIPGGTNEAVEDFFFSNETGSFANYYYHNSYGNAWVTGEVHGPYLIDPAEIDGYYDFSTIALQRAHEEGVDLTQFNRIVTAHNHSEGITNWGGVCNLGMSHDAPYFPGGPRGNFSKCHVKSSVRSLRVTTHEVGHAFGLNHAKRLKCRPVLQSTMWFKTPYSDSCGAETYADYMDVMGGGSTAYFSAAHKSELGWLPQDNVMTATEGEFIIYPGSNLPTPGQYQLLQIPYGYEKLIMGGDPNMMLTVDYRQPVGYDNPMHSYMINNVNETSGVHIRFAQKAKMNRYTGEYTAVVVAGEGNYTNYTTAGGTIYYINRHSVLPGESYLDWHAGINITTLEATNEYARVKVEHLYKEETGPGLNFTFDNNYQNTGWYNPLIVSYPPTSVGSISYEDSTLSLNQAGKIDLRSLGEFFSGMVGTREALTLSLWVKPESEMSMTIGTFGPVSLTSNIFPSPGRLTVGLDFQEYNEVYQNFNEVSAYVFTDRPPLNEWTHIAVTYDGTEMRTYFNGVVQGGTTQDNLGNSLSTVNVSRASSDFIIGSYDGAAGSFIGNIDNVSMYVRALGPGEIAALAGIAEAFAIYPLSPTNGATFNTSSLSFEAEIVSDTAVLSCTLVVDATEMQTVDSPQTDVSFGPFVFEDGSHTWHITCQNELFEEAQSEEAAFIIDSQPPVLSNIVYDEIAEPNMLYHATGTVEDLSSGTMTAYVEGVGQSGASWTTSPASFSLIWGSPQEIGSTELVIKAVDAFDNIQEVHLPVLVGVNDEQAPTYTDLTYPETVYVGDIAELSAIWYDDYPDTVRLEKDGEPIDESQWTDGESVTFSWTAQDIGTYTFVMIATDMSGNEKTTSPMIVNVIEEELNSPPTISIPDKSFAEDQTLRLDISPYVHDADGDSVSTSIDQGTKISVSKQGEEYTFTPEANWNGQETLTATADDGMHTTTDTFIITVTAVNDAPVVDDIPDQIVSINTAFSQVTLDSYVVDVEDGDVAILWEVTGEEELITDITSRVATISAPVDWIGEETLTFTATDSEGEQASDSATFTVLPADFLSVRSISPADGNITNNPLFTFSAQGSSIIVNCSLFINNEVAEVVMVNALQTTQTIPLELDDDVYSWHVACVDEEERTNTSETRSITVDITPPTFPAGRISQSVLDINQEETFSLTLADAQSVSMTLTNPSNTQEVLDVEQVGNSFTSSYTPLIGGRYYLTITATDLVGNTAQKTEQIIVAQIIEQLINASANQTVNINEQEFAGINLTFNQSVINGSINFTYANISLRENISGVTSFVRVDASPSIAAALSYGELIFTYSDAVLQSLALPEASLRIQYFNESNNSWVELTEEIDFVHSIVHDQDNNRFTINLSHFSDYALQGQTTICANNAHISAPCEFNSVVYTTGYICSNAWQASACSSSGGNDPGGSSGGTPSGGFGGTPPTEEDEPATPAPPSVPTSPASDPTQNLPSQNEEEPPHTPQEPQTGGLIPDLQQPAQKNVKWVITGFVILLVIIVILHTTAGVRKQKSEEKKKQKDQKAKEEHHAFWKNHHEDKHDLEVRHYIKGEKVQGKTKTDIIADLTSHGWEKEDAQDAVNKFW